MNQECYKVRDPGADRSEGDRMSVKRTQSALYAHKSNMPELTKVLLDRQGFTLIDAYSLQCFLYWADENVPYDIIKYDLISEAVSLIGSPDWDTAYEPSVGDSYRWARSGWDCQSPDFTGYSVPRARSGGNRIYHSKEFFVSDDYEGFDVGTARQRTEAWHKIPKEDRPASRIGNRPFWTALMNRYGLPYDRESRR